MSELVLNVKANAAGLVEIDNVLTRLELLLKNPTSVNLTGLNTQVNQLEKEAATTTETVTRLEKDLASLAEAGKLAAKGAGDAGVALDKLGGDAANAEKTVNLLTASYSTLANMAEGADAALIKLTAEMKTQADKAAQLQGYMAKVTEDQRATMAGYQAQESAISRLNSRYAVLVELNAAMLDAKSPLLKQMDAEIATTAELAVAQGAITEARYAELTGVMLLTEAEIELTTAQKASAGVQALRDKETATQLELQTAMVAAKDAALAQDKAATVQLAKQALAQGAITEARYNDIAGIKKQTVEIAQETVAMKGATASARNLNGAMRGAAGATGTLWLSYGELLPLLAAFASVSATIKGYKDALNFEYAVTYMHSLGEATGDTTANIKGLRAGLLSIRDVTHGPSELAVALKALTKAGFSASEGIKELQTLSRLATVSEEDLAVTTTAVISQFRAWSEESVGAARGVSTMSQAANILAAAALTTTLDVGELSKMMKYTPVLASQTAASFTEVTAALGTMSNMGVRGTKAATSLRTAMLQLQSPTSKTRKILKDYGLEIDLFTKDKKLKSMTGLFDALAHSLKGLAAPDRVRIFKSLFSIRAAGAGAVMLQQFNKAVDDGTFSFKKQVEMLENVKREGRFIDDMYKGLEKTTETLWDETKAALSRAALEGLDTAPVKELVTTLKDFADSGALTIIARGLGAIVNGLVDLAKHDMPLRAMGLAFDLLTTAATVATDKMDSLKAGVDGLAPSTLVMLNAADLLQKKQQQGYQYTNSERMAVARLTDAYGSLGKAYVATEFDGKIQASAKKVQALVIEQDTFFKNMQMAGKTPENLAIYKRMQEATEAARAEQKKLIQDRKTASENPVEWQQRVASRDVFTKRTGSEADTTAETIRLSQKRRDVEMHERKLTRADRLADSKFKLDLLKQQASAELISAEDVRVKKKAINDQIRKDDLSLLQAQLKLAEEKHQEAVTNAASPTATDDAEKLALKSEEAVQTLEQKIKQKKLEQSRADIVFAKDTANQKLEIQRKYDAESLKLSERISSQKKALTLTEISQESQLLEASKTAKLMFEQEYLDKKHKLQFDALNVEETSTKAHLKVLQDAREQAMNLPKTAETSSRVRELNLSIDNTVKALAGVDQKRAVLRSLISLEDVARARSFSDALKEIRKSTAMDAAGTDFDLGIRKLGSRDQELARTRRGNSLKRDEDISALMEKEGPSQETFRKVEKLNKAYQERDDEIVSGYAKKTKASQDFWGGMEKGMNDYLDSSSDVFGQSADWVTSSFNKMGDALANFVTTGKLNFKDLARSIISDLARMIAKQLMFNAVKGMMNSFGGSGIGAAAGSAVGSVIAGAANGAIWAGNFQPVQGFASGTPKIDKPTLGLVGEGRYPEAIVPLPDGRSIPAKVEGVGLAVEKAIAQHQQPAQPQNIRIVNAFDSAVVGDYIGSDAGEKAVLNVIKHNQSTVKQMMV